MVHCCGQIIVVNIIPKGWVNFWFGKNRLSVLQINFLNFEFVVLHKILITMQQLIKAHRMIWVYFFSDQTRVLGGQPSTAAAAVLQKSTDEIIIKLCVKRMQLLFAPQQESIVSIMNLRATECHSYWLLISFGAEAVIRAHSLEIKGLFLMEISSKTLQNLPYFWNKTP